MAKDSKTSEIPLSSDSFEYGLLEVHRNVESERFGSKPNTVEAESYKVKGRKEVEVKVSVEFPTMADPKAEESFNELLKSIWMKKIELGSGQN